MWRIGVFVLISFQVFVKQGVDARRRGRRRRTKARTVKKTAKKSAVKERWWACDEDCHWSLLRDKNMFVGDSDRDRDKDNFQ